MTVHFYRTLVRVERVSAGVAEAVVPAWDPGRRVHFPARLLPEGVGADSHCFAEADLGSERSDGLGLRNFESALPPDPDDGLA